jgi:hypothetical protein
MDDVWIDEGVLAEFLRGQHVDAHQLVLLMMLVSTFIQMGSQAEDADPSLKIAAGRLRPTATPDYQEVNVEDFIVLVKDGFIPFHLRRELDDLYPVAKAFVRYLEAHFD